MVFKVGVSFRLHIPLSNTIAKYGDLTEKESRVLNSIDLKIMKKCSSQKAT